jgi:Protein of unknown function (DUF3225)
MIDDAAVIAEVRAAFDAYERALRANEVDAMDAWFWADPRTLRYGIAECLYGYDEIAAWRATASPVPSSRTITTSVITAFGADCAVVDCEFVNGDEPGRGRQSQTWIRFDDGWKIVRAHVSMIDA